MSNLLQSLLHLQQLDDKLLEMEQNKREFPDQILAWQKEFDEDKKGLEEKKKRQKDATLKQRNLEKELEESNQQLNKKESRKFDVKSNEEYRALLKEIDYTKGVTSKIEDDILMLFEELETLEKSIEEEEKTIQDKERQLRTDKKRLEQEIVSIDLECRNTQEERRKISLEMHKETLDDYEKTRHQRMGQAVVLVHKEVCPGCHMRIPPQTINEVLQTGEIRHCPHCRRILYCELPKDTA